MTSRDQPNTIRTADDAVRNQPADSGRSAPKALDSPLGSQNLFNFLEEIFVCIDHNLNSVDGFSPAYEKLFERSAAALHSDPYDFLESVHPDDRERVESLRTLSADGVPATCEHRILLAEGRVRTLHTRLIPPVIYDPDGATELWLFRDITIEHANVDTLQQRLEIEQVIARVAGDFMHERTDRSSTVIERTLPILAEFVGADSAHVLLYDQSDTQLEMSHAWYSGDNESDWIPDPIQRLSQLSWWQKHAQVEQFTVINDINELKPEPRAELNRLQVDAMILFPLVVNGRTIGFLTFESTTGPQNWPMPAIVALGVVGDIFAGALQRAREEEALLISEQRNRALIESLPDVIIVMDSEGKHLDVHVPSGFPIDRDLESICR